MRKLGTLIQFSKRIAGAFILISLAAPQSFAQDHEEAFRLINMGKLDSAILVGRQVLKKDPNNPAAYLAVGRGQMRKGEIAGAVQSLLKALSFRDAVPHIRAWAQHDLAICYYYSGSYHDAKKALSESIKLKATPNATASATKLNMLFGFSDVYSSWSVKESEHFIFHIQNQNIEEVDRFIMKKEAAFEKINGFFNAKLPKKIDYFVWSEPASGEAILARPLAFTETLLCLTHTTEKNSIGHEMTHSISSHAVKIRKKHGLISEGVCVYFDLTGRNNISSLTRLNKRVVISEIWSDERRQPDELIYPLGGELVKRLIEAHGREKFLRLLEDQSFESAQNIYGDSLTKIIEEIEREVNHHK